MKKKKLWGIIRAIAGLCGAGVGFYAGLPAILPVILIFFALLITAKNSRKEFKPFVYIFGIQAGHVATMLIGAIVLHMFYPVGVEAIIVIGGLIWLLLKPGFVPVLGLTLYQVAALIKNISEILTVPIGSFPHRAMAVTIAIRILTLIGLIAALHQTRNPRKAAALVTAV